MKILLPKVEKIRQKIHKGLNSLSPQYFLLKKDKVEYSKELTALMRNM